MGQNVPRYVMNVALTRKIAYLYEPLNNLLHQSKLLCQNL